MSYSVYETTNQVNGKVYRGVHATENPDIFDGYLGSGTVLKQAIKKYGKNNFKREILSVHEDFDDAYDEERRIVDKMFVKRDDTYNLVIGGDGSHQGKDNPLYGKRLSKETKRKMSESRSGENHPLYGKHHSEESKKKMSLAKQGENHPNYGKHRSDETKKKCRESQKGEKGHWFGKHPSEETKNKLRKANGLSSIIVKQRWLDIENENKVHGWKTKVAKNWNIHMSGVSKFMNKYAQDLV